MKDMVEVLDETVVKSVKAVNKAIDDLLEPLVKAREKKEREIFNKEYDMMTELEEDAS